MNARRLQFLIGGGIGALLLFLVLHGMDWAALGQALRNANPLALLAVVLVTVAAYCLRALRWGALLLPLVKVHKVDLFSATMVGFASSLVVPRSGELLRPWLISSRYALPTSAGFATIVIERLIDLITVLALFALYLVALPRPELQMSSALMDALTLGGGIAALVALSLLILLLALHTNAERVVPMLERMLVRAPDWLAKLLGRLLRRFSEGLAVLRAPAARLGLIAVQSLVLWLLTAFAFDLTQMAFGIDLPFQTTLLLIAFLMVGEAIPTPGFVGGFHAFYVLALVEVYGVDRTLAVAAAITAHALTNLPVLLLGTALLGREGRALGRLAGATVAVRPKKDS